MPRLAPEPTAVDGVADHALRQFSGYNMKRAFNELQAGLRQVLDPFGLRRVTYSALALIATNRGVSPSQLAEALAVERANLVSILDELETRGLIARRANPEDRRALVLEVTGTGNRLYAQALRDVQAHDDRIQAGLSRAERDALRRMLNHIEANAKGDAG